MPVKTFVFPDAVSLMRLVAQQGVISRRSGQPLQLDLGSVRSVARRVLAPEDSDLLQVSLVEESNTDVFFIGGVRDGSA